MPTGILKTGILSSKGSAWSLDNKIERDALKLKFVILKPQFTIFECSNLKMIKCSPLFLKVPLQEWLLLIWGWRGVPASPRRLCPLVMSTSPGAEPRASKTGWAIPLWEVSLTSLRRTVLSWLIFHISPLHSTLYFQQSSSTHNSKL